MRKIRVADLFCGAGGSSTGARQAIEAMGREMDLVCVNHWDRAIETHKRMHPEARHYCQDVASARPIECVPGGHLDLLMASPTCTYHSRARGGRPTSDQQRMDPWHVVTWLTELTVDRLIIENVPEFADWGPVDPKSGKPIKAKKGVYHAEWVATLDRLEFDYTFRFLNCADFGDATTRRRYFGLGRRRKGRKIVQIKWPEPTHTKDPGHSLLAPLQKWRPARECIDWSMKGRSIFGRKHPLAPRTIQRIYAGAVRFNWPEPFLVVLRQHMDARSIDLPMPTVAARGTHMALVEPILVGAGGRAGQSPALSVRQPIGAITTKGDRALAEPVLIRSDSHGARKIKGRSPDEPLQTIVGSGGIAIAEPFLIGQHGERRERAIDSPVRTITGIDRQAVVEPFVVSATHHGGFRGYGLDTPMPTVTGAHRGESALVEPFVLSQASGGAPRAVEQPIPAATTGGRGGAHALITPYYGSGSGMTCKPVDEPLDTVTTLDRFGMVVPVTHAGGGPVAREMHSPFPTLTTSKGGHLAFITASFGERDGQLPRTHDLEMPMPTIPAKGSVRMAQGVEPGGEPQYDILFRMLHWRELARAMSFSDAESEYEFAGTKTEITKQIGNAVPVRTARALVGAALWDMAA
jgi:DNA (cytosine-5)-methyltransferase 1